MLLNILHTIDLVSGVKSGVKCNKLLGAKVIGPGIRLDQSSCPRNIHLDNVRRRRRLILQISKKSSGSLDDIQNGKNNFNRLKGA